MWDTCLGDNRNALQASEGCVDTVRVDTDQMMRCTPVGWWKGYWVSVTSVALGGGLVMLVAAAIARDSASIPLIIIGAGWFACGLLAMRQHRRTAQEVQLNGNVLTFQFPKRRESVSVGDIEEIRRTRGDLSHFAPIQVRTVGGEVIRLPPRLSGLIDLLVEIRSRNPAVRIGDF